MSRFPFTAVTTALCLAFSFEPALGNGWASGLNHVPLVEAATAVDSAGNQLDLDRGSPVYVTLTDDEIETSVRWPTRPFERAVKLPRSALPEKLQAYRSYRDEDFGLASRLFQSEAETSLDPLVRNWKWILAGHAKLLFDPDAYEDAVALYDRAAHQPHQTFSEYGAYFAFRAMLASGEYSEALSRLRRLTSVIGNDLEDNVLFSTYPLSNDRLAGWSVNLPKLDNATVALSVFIDVVNAREQLPDDAGSAALAAAMYAEAEAREELYAALPEGFYDYPHSKEAVDLLQRIVNRYPHTRAAELAYRDYLFTYERLGCEPGGDHSKVADTLRTKFLEKFPESDLLDENNKEGEPDDPPSD